MCSKSFSFWLWYTRHHPHLDHNLAGIEGRLRLDGVSVLAAEVSIHWIATQCFSILVELQCSISIFDLNVCGVHEQVGRHVRARHLSAIGAVAEMTAWFIEEMLFFERHRNRSAQAGAGHAVLKLIGLVLLGISRRRVRHGGQRVARNSAVWRGTLMDEDAEHETCIKAGSEV